MMNPRVLGYLALSYALLTSSGALRLAWLFIGEGDSLWAEGVHGLLWLGFAVGAVGLVLETRWARALTLSACAGQVLLGAAGLVLGLFHSLALAGVFGGLSTLVPLAFIIGLLKAPQVPAPQDAPAESPVPDADHERHARVEYTPAARSRRRLDLAYAAFTFCAVFPWVLQAAAVLGERHLAPDGAQMYAMLLWLPVTAAVVFSFGSVVVVTLMEWRRWQLWALLATLAVQILVFVKVDVRNAGAWDVPLLWYAGASALMLAICVRWFVVERPGTIAP
jgi:hypothetical protein